MCVLGGLGGGGGGVREPRNKGEGSLREAGRDKLATDSQRQ